MDPPEAYSGANAAVFKLAEIWQFPMNGGGVSVGEARGGFGLKVEHFSPNIGFRTIPVSLEQRGAREVGARKRREAQDELAKGVSTSSGNGNGNGVNQNDCDGKRLKTSGCREENGGSKAEAQPSSGKLVEQNAQPPEPPKQDYIHVRARRGQATDSHSLAERARREKISERMKILQDLVPGCNKVIGKALVLDEIINYIQSLQHQVEFLSMKLEAVNTRMNPSIEVFPPKDFGQQTFDAAGVAFGSQATREHSRGSSPEWLHMQVGGAFERTT